MMTVKRAAKRKLAGALAAAVTALAMLVVASPASALEITSFDGGVFDDVGDPVTQAGSHPHSASASFVFSQHIRPDGKEWALEDPKDIVVDLPPGFVGNPQAVRACTVAELQGERGALANPQCPDGSQVGILTLWQNGLLGKPGAPVRGDFAIYNMVAPKGTLAVFGINVSSALVSVAATVRTGGDYGVTTTSLNTPVTIPLAGIDFTIWGVPADPSHDAERSCPTPSGHGCPSTAPLKPFLSLPTSCVGPVRTDTAITGWFGGSDSASFLSHDNTKPVPNPIGNDGCAGLHFSPTLKARPTTNVADSPSGLEVDLEIPQSEDPLGTATAHLKDTVVTLPEGLNVNPASANGLDACSSAQIGLTSAPDVTPITYTPAAANCPNASKLGTVEVDTPALDHPVPGAVYLAKPFDNPFNSLLAIYIAIDDPESGVVAKIAGEVRPNPITGQLTTVVEDNPQLPFEHVRLNFFGGAGGSLRTPDTCGSYSTTSSLTPWSAPDSGPPATPSDTYSIVQGPGGGSCATSSAARPNRPSFDAGTVSPIAGAYSPFVVNLRREDGSQQFSSLTLSPPQGLVGKLAGTPICPDSALAVAAAKTGSQEKAAPSCPAASEVGSVVAAAGAGPAPYYAPGKAYLTGPYKGAPLSLAVVTPATAGPFDLGTIVVKTALYVDSKTAQITAVSDPIPHILQGIVLDVRAVTIKMDKPQFILNPSSCDPMAVEGRLVSVLGQSAPLSSRFQLGECGRLGFKPRLTLSLKGGTKRSDHPALTAVLTPRPGDANIASVSVALPHSEFLDQSHIRTVCTRVQFAADACPAAAIYGESTVTTPLLDYPLSGHVYLRSSDNLLPDLVPDLRGPPSQPIKLESAGRTDSINGGLRNSFGFVPDAPFSKFTLSLPGGKKGLLVNSRDICGRPYKAAVKFSAHNGLTYTSHPVLKAKCGKKAKKGKGAGNRSR